MESFLIVVIELSIIKDGDVRKFENLYINTIIFSHLLMREKAIN